MTSTLLWYSVLVVCLVLILNCATGVFFYVKRTKFDPPVVLSPQQRKLLGVKNDGNYCYSVFQHTFLKFYLL